MITRAVVSPGATPSDTYAELPPSVQRAVATATPGRVAAKSASVVGPAMTLHVHALGWAELDPHLRPAFDPAVARALVAPLILPRPGVHRGHPGAAVHTALLSGLGLWSAGWSWARADGGPLSGAAFAGLMARGPEQALAGVVAALEEWQRFLLDLAALFATLRREDAGRPLEDRVERAAARILPLVAARTQHDDAWYGCFTEVLRWYLESCGLTGPHLEPAIDGVVSGRFASWVGPSAEVAALACAELGLAVAEADARPAVDGTAAWWQLRERGFAAAPAAPARTRVGRDGHRAYIDRVDRARDPLRADRMHAALDLCRADARAGRALTFEALAVWQAAVLAVPAVDLRQADAYAKHGREYYPRVADLRGRLDRALADAHGDASVAVRAARVYLDLCFLHPFADGNARAARLALDHVLTRAGLALHRAEPLFVVARAADDARGAWTFAFVVEQLVGLAPASG
ncbi:MAG: Fic family protein [Myxococcales bacterium]|nr:Fic family protein [Myxococcales bacterium]